MRSIFLIGFMGCGKTTVGRVLAERLGWSFVDLDQRIADAEQRTIPEIFAGGGELTFRAAERRALEDVVSERAAVVATGGGLFSNPENRRLIVEGGGWSVFLDVAWSLLEARLGSQDSSRPMWGSSRAAQALFEERLGDYRMADVVVAVGDGQIASDVAEAIILLSPELECAI